MNVDYKSYTKAELVDVYNNVDRSKHPEIFFEVEQLLESRNYSQTNSEESNSAMNESNEQFSFMYLPGLVTCLLLYAITSFTYSTLIDDISFNGLIVVVLIVILIGFGVGLNSVLDRIQACGAIIVGIWIGVPIDALYFDLSRNLWPIELLLIPLIYVPFFLLGYQLGKWSKSDDNAP